MSSKKKAPATNADGKNVSKAEVARREAGLAESIFQMFETELKFDNPAMRDDFEELEEYTEGGFAKHVDRVFTRYLNNDCTTDDLMRLACAVATLVFRSTEGLSGLHFAGETDTAARDQFVEALATMRTAASAQWELYKYYVGRDPSRARALIEAA